MRRLALVAALGLSLTCLSACGHDDPRVDPGTVVAALDHATGSQVSVLVPTGQVVVDLGKPVDSVAKRATKKLQGVRAPSGGSLIPVRMTFDIAPAPWGGALQAMPQPADVTIAVGDASYDLGSPYAVSGNALADIANPDVYVAVDGKPSVDSVKVTVTYDGVGRTVDAAGDRDHGQAGRLERLSTSTPPGLPCGSRGWTSDDPRLTVEVGCEIVSVGRTPYFPGVGWAPDGSEWVVVLPEVSLLSASHGSRPLRVTGATDRTTLGGVRPRTPMVQLPSGNVVTVSGPLVFREPIGRPEPLQLRVAFQLDLEQTVVVARDLRIPADA